jgi:ribonuclease Z
MANQIGGVRLLIHEATFDDALSGEAEVKRHSTVGEACAMGAACGAEHTILTHFSQRYPKVPPIKHAGVSFAFDHLCVPFEGLEAYARATTVFSALTAEYETWESGTSKRLREEA